jgi:hypothetical protein
LPGTRCLLVQMVCCLAFLLVWNASTTMSPAPKGLNQDKLRQINSIQEELKSQRLLLEAEEGMLKKISELQRETENAHVTISQKDAQIGLLKEQIEALQEVVNASRNSDNNPSSSPEEAEKVKKTEEEKKTTKAENEIIAEAKKNTSRHTGPNSLSNEAAPVGIAIVIMAEESSKELKKTIASVIALLPATGFPMFVAEAGTDNATSKY